MALLNCNEKAQLLTSSPEVLMYDLVIVLSDITSKWLSIIWHNFGKSILGTSSYEDQKNVMWEQKHSFARIQPHRPIIF